MTGITSLGQLLEILCGQDVRTAYVKYLSPNQDDEKNQIYLGRGLDGVTNLFPGSIEVRSASESLTKRRSSAGRPKLEAVKNSTSPGSIRQARAMTRRTRG